MTVGVLFAPKSGVETREYLANRASDGSDYLADQAQQIKSQASDIVEKGKNILSDQKEKLGTAAQQVQNVYQS